MVIDISVDRRKTKDYLNGISQVFRTYFIVTCSACFYCQLHLCYYIFRYSLTLAGFDFTDKQV